MADRPTPDAVPTENASASAPEASMSSPSPSASPSASAPTGSTSTTSKLSSLFANKAIIVIVGLVCVAAGAFLVAYVLYWLINRSLISKRGTTLPQTKTPIIGTQLTKISGVQSPVSSNGKRFSMCFWIYVHDIDKYRGSTRHVFHIGDDEASTASPVVFFDSTSNKLMIGFSPLNKSSDNKFPAENSRETDIILYLATKYGITIDYIPIQRWVHVCVVVNEESSGGIMSAYVDGDLVKVMTTGTTNVYANKYKSVTTIQNLNISRAGSLVIGGSTSDPIGPGFSGLVSKIRLFNYDLNVNDIYYDYRSGPIDNLLAKLGLPAYGVRSPIYKI